MAEITFYSKEPAYIKVTQEKFHKIETSLQQLYKRWEELEKLKN